MKFTNNRFLDALAKLMLLSAVLHMLLVLVYSVTNRDIVHLNYFNILDLDLFFPDIIQGTTSQIASIAITLALFLIIYIRFTEKE